MCSCVLEAKSISVLYTHFVTYPFHFWISRIFRFDHWDHWDPWTMQHEAFCSAARASMLSAPLRGSCQRRCMSGKQNTTDIYRYLQITTENSETTQVKKTSIIFNNHLQLSEIHLNQHAEVVIRMPAWMRLAFRMDLLVPFGFAHLRRHREPQSETCSRPWFWPEALVVCGNLSDHSVLSISFLAFLHGFSWHSPLHASSWWSWCNPMMNPICINPQKMHTKGTNMDIKHMTYR